MGTKQWTIEDIPQLKGKIVIVTGANSGLGFYTAKALAARQAKVIMACRSITKGQEALRLIKKMIPEADLVLLELDLADLQSVRNFSNQIHSGYKKLDMLINNAGLMAIPFHKTADGFEMQFGVNHLGHFALTGLLMDLLLKTPDARIINVSSMAHRMGKIRFEDVNWDKGYSKWKAYGMSKLANLLFTEELVRRLNGHSDQLKVTAAHPGYADTELQSKGAEMKGSKLSAKLFRFANKLVAQSGEMGALPTLYAATAPDVKQAGYYGPGGILKMKGYPAADQPKQDLMDPEVARKLWELSEEMTGVKFGLPRS
jgi:NAD(P)-dependent dehydrogenase (short-subunit alcohol dehydrogenase family)